MSKRNQRIIAEELAKVGLKPHAIAGILANIEYESSFSTAINNGDGGRASGIAQWHPDRFARVRQIAKKMGVPVTNIRAQARALAVTIKDERQSGPTGTTTVRSLNKLPNAGAVAKFFDENYERSAGATRQARVQAASNYIKVGRNAAKGTSVGGKKKTYTWVPGMTDSDYNPFKNPNSRYQAGYHTGNDISAKEGAKIIWAPPVTGKVISRGTSGDYGNHMVIRDELGREWLFAHMNTKPLKVGRKVSQGVKIGEVGNTGTSTGPHLHIEQTRPGKGTWKYNSELLKNPKITFKAANEYNGGSDLKPSDFLSSLGVPRSWLDNPGMEEVADLVDKAARNDWSEQRFMWKMRETEWYQQRTENQRTFDMLQSKDQEARVNQARAQLRKTARQFGIDLTDKQIDREALSIARNGDSPEMIQAWVARKFVYDPVKGQPGLTATFQEDLMDLAGEYGLDLSDKQLQRWTRDFIAADSSPEDFEQEMRERAEKLYPTLDLKSRTLREALASYLQVASRELGVQIDQFDLTDPKWTEVFAVDSGEPVSTVDWRKKILSDKRYGWEQSENGQRAAMALATAIGSVFGGSR
jgi:murein DD-endopeptidase MepM/ murein hydrolase activator NlpD